jgi:hypothetical protein
MNLQREIAFCGAQTIRNDIVCTAEQSTEKNILKYFILQKAPKN